MSQKIAFWGIYTILLMSGCATGVPSAGQDGTTSQNDGSVDVVTGTCGNV